MKNIHIISTDKPSRLYLTTHEYIFEEGYSLSTDECENKNIYITNDEEIKDGDYYLYLKDNKVYQFIRRDHTKLLRLDIQKKIILTTDQDLIKDGVQAIDYNFLEWFVKNPSCEYVNIEKYCRNGLCDSKSRSKRDKMDEHRHEDPKDKCWYSGCQCPGERLIVPKKNFYCGDEVDYDDKCLEQCDGCVDATGIDYGYLPKEIHLEDIFNDEKKEGIKKLIQKQKLIDMMEQDEQLGLYQETLEESFLANIKNVLQFGNDAQAIRFMEKYFEAKQKRSYSEEEVKLAFIEGHNVCRCVTDNTDLALECFKKWFEQFKKK